MYFRDGFDYLRLIGENVETSQGVKLPLAYAIKIYNKVKDGALTVGSKILDYEVSNVGKFVTVGCHNFKTSYLLNFGSKLVNN